MLSGFSGRPQCPLREVTPLTEAKGVKTFTTYTVVDFLSIYNVIAGRPLIHSMRVVSYSFHQVIKFPTPWEVQENQGDQSESRECYITAMKVTTKLKGGQTPRAIIAAVPCTKLPGEELEEVVIDVS